MCVFFGGIYLRNGFKISILKIFKSKESTVNKWCSQPFFKQVQNTKGMENSKLILCFNILHSNGNVCKGSNGNGCKEGLLTSLIHRDTI